MHSNVILHCDFHGLLETADSPKLNINNAIHFDVEGTVCDFCTDQSCPTMSGGPQYEYQWADGSVRSTPKQPTPTRLCTRTYTRTLLCTRTYTTHVHHAHQWISTNITGIRTPHAHAHAHTHARTHAQNEYRRTKNRRRCRHHGTSGC